MNVDIFMVNNTTLAINLLNNNLSQKTAHFKPKSCFKLNFDLTQVKSHVNLRMVRIYGCAVIIVFCTITAPCENFRVNRFNVAKTLKNSANFSDSVGCTAKYYWLTLFEKLSCLSDFAFESILMTATNNLKLTRISRYI